MTKTQINRCNALIAQLRSGEVKQITGALKCGKGKDSCYCILGMFAKVYKDRTGNGVFSNGGARFGRKTPYGVDYRHSYIPNIITNYFGLPLRPANIDVPWYRLNDVCGYSFNRFADIIEEYVKENAQG